MKILISAGIKTGNIVSTVKRKYSKGDVEIFSKQFTTLIPTFFEQGNYFDRAIILEEGISPMGLDNLENVRKDIINFVNLVKNKCSVDTTLVWVVTNKEIAQLICEETLELYGRSIVLIRNPNEKLVTSFFVNIISNTLDAVHPDLVFTIKDIQSKPIKVTDFSESGEKDVLRHVQDMDITQMHIIDTPVQETGVPFDSIFGDAYDTSSETAEVKITEEVTVEDAAPDTPVKVEASEQAVTSLSPVEEAESEVAEEVKEVITDVEDEVTSDIGDEMTFGVDKEISTEDKEKTTSEVGAEIKEENTVFEETVEADLHSELKEDADDSVSIGMAQEKINIDTSMEQQTEDLTDKVIEHQEMIIDDLGEIKSMQERSPEFEVTDEVKADESEQDITINKYDELYAIDEDANGTSSGEEVATNDSATSNEDYAELFNDENNAENNISDVAADDIEQQTEISFEDEDYSSLFSETEDETADIVEESTEETGAINDISIESLFGDTSEETESTDDNVLNDEGAKEVEEDNTEDDNLNKDTLATLFQDESENVEDTDIELATPVVVKKKGFFSNLFKGKKSIVAIEDTLRELLNSYKGRGSSIVVTGPPSSGKTTVVANLANVISRLGYTVLVVDMDTRGRGQCMITRQNYNAIHSVDTANPSLKQALNTTYGNIGKFVSVVTPTLHLLGMGLASDITEGDRLASRTRLSKFINTVRTNYCVTIYDLPVREAGDYAADVVVAAEHIVITSEYSNYGAANLMLELANLETEEVESVLFTRGQICLTKVKDTKLKTVLGRVTHTPVDYLKSIDKEISGLLGTISQSSFSELRICGNLPYDTRNDALWYTTKLISDSTDGWELYTNLLYSVLLKQ